MLAPKLNLSPELVLDHQNVFKSSKALKRTPPNELSEGYSQEKTPNSQQSAQPVLVRARTQWEQRTPRSN